MARRLQQRRQYCDSRRRLSAGLVDVDLDCEEAIELAPLYLPETGAIFGRKSAPKSHWLYIADGANFAKFDDSIAQDTLLKLRAEGRNGGAQISLGPPSIADGEAREWHGDVIEPAAFGARALQIYAARRAIGCLTMRVTPVAGLGRRLPLTENLQNFINRVGAERTMFETKMPVLGGSQTAARLVEEAEGSASSNPAWNMTVGASERRCGLRRRSVIR